MTEADRFGTAGLRQRVLDAWAASPARFREDANAEEDLVLGGYRERVLVELAQNAADAATAAGRPGRLRFTLRERPGAAPVLVAANTGAPLDADGVQALATLRASAKRSGDTVGRFGVGFAAVLAVTDEPAVVGRSGGVRFSAAGTRELVGARAARDAPALAVELDRRDGQVPVLRLPFDADGAPPDGYDTAVVLPLRDSSAAATVARLLADVGDPLLLALPALAEIVVEVPGRAPTVLRDAGSRWHVLRREGRLPAGALAGRPVEERGRDRWTVTWALPRPPAAGAEAPAVPGVVHAPTPGDEPLPWPALLIATLPLDPSRRHVAPGPVTDAVVEAAATAYADLLAERAAAGEDAWRLVVTGLPAGRLDADLRAAAARRLPGTPLLAAAADPAVRLRPRDALALAGAAGADVGAVGALAHRLAGLVLAPRAAAAALELLGVRRISLSDAVEALPAAAEPERWRELYAALEPLALDPVVRESLALLPVPLAGGGVVRGPRGLLMTPDGPGDALAGALSALGARTVHPAAAHPLLERLGAVPATARAALDLPVVRAAVEALADLDAPPDGPTDPWDEMGDGARPDAPGRVAAVLTLVTMALTGDGGEHRADAGDGRQPAGVAGDRPAARAGDRPDESVDELVAERPWLGDLPLPDADGGWSPAAALALPGSRASRWFDPDEVGVLDVAVLERWGARTLRAVGVLDGVGRLRAADTDLDPDGDDGPAAELDGWDDWLEAVADEVGGLPPGAALPELLAARDLDLVRPEALPEVVAAIAADPALRPALVVPARIRTGAGPVDAPPYTAWWLRRELFGAGALAGPDAAPPLPALLPAAPDWVRGLDPAARRALGVLTSVADLDAAAAPALLDRLADPGLDLPADHLVAVVARLAELAAGGFEVDRPDRVRAVDGDGSTVVPADRAVVVEAPMYRQRPDLGAPLPAPPRYAAALADLLDLPLAGELAEGRVEGGGEPQPVPAPLLALLPRAPREWCEHDRLVVDGVEVDWWVGGQGPAAGVHAATVDGLARALAWAAGRWELRAAAAALLAEPEAAVDVMVDQVFAG